MRTKIKLSEHLDISRIFSAKECDSHLTQNATNKPVGAMYLSKSEKLIMLSG